MSDLNDSDTLMDIKNAIPIEMQLRRKTKNNDTNPKKRGRPMKPRDENAPPKELKKRGRKPTRVKPDPNAPKPPQLKRGPKPKGPKKEPSEAEKLARREIMLKKLSKIIEYFDEFQFN